MPGEVYLRDFIETVCPYCGENINIEVDHTGGREQDFISDCEVCCRPINFHVKISEDDVVSLTCSGEG